MITSCFFSIIIPVFNAEKYLTECLLSIQKQDFDDFEVICVNDGSSDNSREILETFVRNDSRFLVFSTENQGVSAARNYGMEKIHGKYFTFVDADDILLEGALSFYKDVVEKRDIDIFIERGFLKFWETERPAPLDGDFSDVLNTKAAARYFIERGLEGYACGKIYRSSQLKHLRFPIGCAMFEDLYMFVHLWENEYTFLYYSGSHYGYRQHASAATKNISGKKRLDVLFVYRDIFRYMAKEGYSKKEMSSLLPHIKCYANWNEYFKLSDLEQKTFLEYISEIIALTGKSPCDVFMKLRVYVLNGHLETILRFGEYLYYGSKKRITCFINERKRTRKS